MDDEGKQWPPAIGSATLASSPLASWQAPPSASCCKLNTSVYLHTPICLPLSCSVGPIVLLRWNSYHVNSMYRTLHHSRNTEEKRRQENKQHQTNEIGQTNSTGGEEHSPVVCFPRGADQKMPNNTTETKRNEEKNIGDVWMVMWVG
jgi:hypothetical protein